MSTPTITIRLNENDAAAADRILGNLAHKAERPEGGLKLIGEALMETTRDRFQSQTGPDGQKWPALKPFTVSVRGAAGPILTRSGRLRNSISYYVSGNILRLGPNVIYDAIHQFGGTIKPKASNPTGLLWIPLGKAGPGARPAKSVTLPKRPYIGFGPKDQQAAEGAVEDWLAVE